MDTKEIIKGIKHDFMVFRNGIVADTLRKSGMPYSIIFGLQLPQLSGISRKFSPATELAYALWADSSVRESRLLACYLFPPEEIDEEKAHALAMDVQTVEEADILSFRLLRHLPFAPALAARLGNEQATLPAYCGKALLRNLEAMA